MTGKLANDSIGFTSRSLGAERSGVEGSEVAFSSRGASTTAQLAITFNRYTEKLCPIHGSLIAMSGS
jgi:hypothetical protein